MDFINDKADPAANDPNGQNISELEARYRELALRAALWPGDPRNNNPQLYFEKLPPELPESFPIPPNTRLLGSLARSAQHLDLFLDTTLTNDRLIEFYTEKLTAAGWQKMDPHAMPGHWGGFMPGNRRMNNTLFCQGSQGPGLNLQTNPDSGDVRINVNLATTDNPCDQSRRQRMMARPMESLIPGLMPPPGNPQSFDGGGGSGNSNSWYSSASLDTDLDLATLVKHYHSQLEKAGWLLSGQGVSGPVAWSQWTLKDKEGEEWQGLLLIYKNFDKARHHFLHVKVERGQPGPDTFQHNIAPLRF